MRSSLLLPSSTIPLDPKSFSSKPLLKHFPSVRAIAAPDSPPKHTPSNQCLQLVYNRLNSSPNSRIPISLRLLQLQKKSLARRRRPQDPSSLCPISSAVWFLIRLLEELQKSSLYVSDEVGQDKVFWNSTEPLVWLFLRVFSTSPNVFSAILGLTASFVAQAVEKSVLETVSLAFDLEMEAPELEVDGRGLAYGGGAKGAGIGGEKLGIGRYWRWGDIGILDDEERVEGMSSSRRRTHYESMIVRGQEMNSLILSNYAQFLYQFEWDLDRYGGIC